MTNGNDKHTSNMMLDLVVFRGGQHTFAVEATQIAASAQLSPEQTVPAIETLLSLSANSDNNQRLVIVVKKAQQNRVISVAAPLDLCSIPASAIHPLPALLAARCTLPGLRALTIFKQQLTLLITLDSK